MKFERTLAQDRRAWGASVQGVVNSISNASSTRPGWMPTQVKVSTTCCISQRSIYVQYADAESGKLTGASGASLKLAGTLHFPFLARIFSKTRVAVVRVAMAVLAPAHDMHKKNYSCAAGWKKTTQITRLTIEILRHLQHCLMQACPRQNLAF